MIGIRTRCLGMLFLACFSSCTHHRYFKAPTASHGSRSQSGAGLHGKGDPSVPDGDPKDGVASWYGEPYHGNKTANGEIYDMDSMTAAHRTLPFGTRVRVTHPQHDKEIEVRINDRGPFVDGRIIDLSREAAKRLGMLNEGISPVRLELVSAHTEMPGKQNRNFPSTSSRYTVQIGCFSDRRNAVLLYGKLKKRYAGVSVEPADGGRFRIQVGQLASRDQAQALLDRLREEKLDGFVRLFD